MEPFRTSGTPATRAAAVVQIETLDGNGMSLSFATREAAEATFRQVRAGNNVQHCALLTHLRDGLYAGAATHCRG